MTLPCIFPASRSIASAALLVLLAAGCPAPSEEIGATLGDSGSGPGDGGDDGSTGDQGGSDSLGGTSQGSGSAGSGSDDTDPSDGGSEDGGSDTGDVLVECFDAWADPVAVVEAPSRPAPGVPGMRLRFTYAPGVVTLTEITDEQVVQPADGPFSPEENSGTWVELRDAADQEVYTRGVFELIPESMEVFGPMGNVVSCPEDGFLQVTNLPNDSSATQIVFFQEAIDGETTNETIELLRFDLPPA